jgi:PAS domain S-box-containing protein
MPYRIDERTLHLCKEESFCAAFEQVGVGVARVGLDGKWLTVNRRFCDIMGDTPKGLLAKRFDESFDRRATEIEDEGWRRLSAGEINLLAQEMSARLKDGRVVWVNAVASLVRDAVTQQPECLFLVIHDISARKEAERALHESEVSRQDISRRLLNAREAERTRIARELHDDIGQSLAVLKIQMLRAGQPLVDGPHSTIPELSQQVQAISEKVGRLSRELHSSELEFLGLAVAVKSHCREVAEDYKLAIDCRCSDIPQSLDSGFALTFLRVVQESLHNVVKHSAAADVQVLLSCNGEELCVRVRDNGVGFDSERYRPGSGLGLISMRERILLADGTFFVSSTPGGGTTVTAAAPLPAACHAVAGGTSA